MTCERGLKDYMICTECHIIITRDAIGIGELFNCREDIALVCSEICREKITEKVENGTWMMYQGFSETISE